MTEQVGNSNNASIIGGGGISTAVKSGLGYLEGRTASINKQMEMLAADTTKDQTKAMVEMQFLVSQYTTTVETTSSVMKSLSDSLKSISQKL